MSEYRIAVIPGDGVGPEVADEAVAAAAAAAEKYGFSMGFDTFDWSCDRYLSVGSMMPEDSLEILADYDAIFLGCIGDANKVPDHVSLEALLHIRKGFDQYVNLRPIRMYPGVTSPVTTADPETLDIMVIRENTEGEYAGVGGFYKQGTPDAVALQTGVFTRKGCERVIRYAFDLARSRSKLGPEAPVGRVTNCTKSNALNYSMVFWDSVFDEVASDFPDIETDMALVDALTMWFVKNPEWFDVVVASNLFGDIITDLGAETQGGMGIAAGGNINPEGVSMFEPIGGSAPKYTGKNIINPLASICAGAMMLETLGETEAATAIEDAVKSVTGTKIKSLSAGKMGYSTSEVGDLVVEYILKG